MLAAARAELLVLRKWPTAWALLLVTPVLMLAVDYFAEFILYLTLTPAEYARSAHPAQNLPSMLPSQFSIIAVSQFTFSAQVPLIVLGALMAGGDWTRGTLRTTLLQDCGRTRAYLGQLAALSVAAIASTVLTFAVAAGASLAVRALEPAAASPYTGAIPPTPAIAGALGAAVLIALAYAALGLALGTICRSAVVAMSIALVWTMIIDSTLYQLAITAGGAAAHDQRPGSWAERGHAVRLVRHARRRRYVAELPAGQHARGGVDAVRLRGGGYRGGHRPAAPPGYRCGPQAPAGAADPRAHPGADAGRTSRTAGRPSSRAGLLAAVRAELLIMRRRPAIWALVLILPADMLIDYYLTQYVEYLTAS